MLRQTELVPTDQKMGDTRMGRQLRHGLAMGCEKALGIQSAQPTEQVTGLGKRCRRRRIQPVQLIGRHPPARQMQRQRGEVRLLDFRGAEAGELLMLGF